MTQVLYMVKGQEIMTTLGHDVGYLFCQTTESLLALKRPSERPSLPLFLAITFELSSQ